MSLKDTIRPLPKQPMRQERIKRVELLKCDLYVICNWNGIYGLASADRFSVPNQHAY